MNKKQAGTLGGQETFRRYGRRHMGDIGSMGGKALWDKYRLVPYGISQFALVDRITGEVKTIRSG